MQMFMSWHFPPPAGERARYWEMHTNMQRWLKTEIVFNSIFFNRINRASPQALSSHFMSRAFDASNNWEKPQRDASSKIQMTRYQNSHACSYRRRKAGIWAVYACAIKLSLARWHGCKIIRDFLLRIIKNHQSWRVILYFIHTHTHREQACTHAVKLICIFKEIKAPRLKLIAACCSSLSLSLRIFILFFCFNRWLWCLTLASGPNRQKIITHSEPLNKTLAELKMSDPWKVGFCGWL